MRIESLEPRHLLAGPEPPQVLSVVRAGSDPTNASTVEFTVTFDEPVTGVDVTDFTLNVGGAIAGASPTQVSGSDAVYAVMVDTGTGEGTIRLNVLDDDSIRDLSNDKLGGNGADNGAFSSGEFYTIDRTAPTTLSIDRVPPTVTTGDSVQYVVNYSEPIAGAAAADYLFYSSPPHTFSITDIEADGDSVVVTVSVAGYEGFVYLQALGGGGIVDLAGNTLDSNAVSSSQFIVDRTPPEVESVVLEQASPGTETAITYLVTFNELVNGFSFNDIELVASNLPSASITSTEFVSPSQQRVHIDTGQGEGSATINILANQTVRDIANLKLATPTTGNPTYVVDSLPPTVTSISRLDATPTLAPTVAFEVGFAEPVLGVDLADFELASDIADASLMGVSGSGAAYTVTVATGTSSGTVGLNVPATATITDLSGNALSTPAVGPGYVVDKTAPTAQSITRAGGSPTSSLSLDFDVVFSESVTGVTADDFAAVDSGVSGVQVASVTGSGSSWTVTVTHMGGDGTIGLDLIDDNSIVDAVGNPLGGSAQGDGDFSGESYQIVSATIAGNVWFDDDRDGVLDPTESGQEGIVVYVDLNDNGLFDGGEPSATTAADDVGTPNVDEAGQYQISGLLPDTTYEVVIVDGPYDQTFPLSFAQDDGTLTFKDGFVAGAQPDISLLSVETVLVSPGGEDIYTTAINGHTLAHFRRDWQADTLTKMPSINGMTPGFDEMSLPSDFALSPDGRFGYLTARSSNEVYVLSRDLATGELSLVEKYKQGVNGIVGLEGPGAVRVSPDGKWLYVAAYVGDTFSVYAIEPATGALTFLQMFEDEVGGITSLNGAREVNVAPDGSQVVVAATFDAGITVFDVDAATGLLSLRRVFGVSNVKDTEFSPDGRFLYAASSTTGGVRIYARDLATGQWTLDSIIAVYVEPIGVGGSPDGKSLYIVDGTSDAVRVFDRDLATGAITSVENLFDVAPHDQLAGVRDVVVTPDGRDLLAVAYSDDSITRFGRRSGATAAVSHFVTTNETDSAGADFGVHNLPPNPLSLTSSEASPTGAASIDFTLTYDESVSGVDLSDFSLSATTVGAAITGVSGGPAQYTIAVNTGTGQGTVQLSLLDDDTIVDGAGEPLGGPGDNASLSSAVIAIDRLPPTVLAVAAADAIDTNAATVSYDVLFSKSVSGVDISDFALTVQGIANAAITSVTPVNATQYTVAVSTGSGDGTIRLDLIDDDSIVDSIGLPLDGGFTAGDSYRVDKTIPVVDSITLIGTPPSGVGSVDYQVVFSEPVSGFTIDDLQLASPGLSGASISSITGADGNYVVRVGTGQGSGSVQFSLVDDDSIVDAAGNPLGGVGAGNGDRAGPIHLVEAQFPTVIATTTFADELDGDTSSLAALVAAPGGTGISLREAIVAANNTPGSAHINLAAGIYSLTRMGSIENASLTGDLDITGDLAIVGVPGATRIDAAGLGDRVLDLPNYYTKFYLFGVAITGGTTPGSGFESDGGGLRANFLTQVTMENVRFADNYADSDTFSQGGALSVHGVTNIIRSTFATNYADNDGGAVETGGASGILTVIESTFENNSTAGGGAIYAWHDIVVESSTFTGNDSAWTAGGGSGGAIEMQSGAKLTLVNSTLSDNVSGSGGALYLTGPAEIINSTIVNNQADRGGGIDHSPSATGIVVRNSILAGNTAASEGPNVRGAIASEGYNLVDDTAGSSGFGAAGDIFPVDAMLGPLADNGGETLTHALLPGSPAIDAASAALAPTLDQRRFTRPIGSEPDIGAVESGSPANAAPVASDDAVTTGEDTPLSIDVLGNDTDGDGDSLTATLLSAATRGVAVVEPDQTISYTPSAEFVGSDQFIYRVNDGRGGSDTATVNVTVTAVNDAPVANDDEADAVDSIPIDISVLGNDSDAENDTLSIAGFTQPANGTVTFVGNGYLRYVSDLGFVGQDAFTYTATDGVDPSLPATVTVSVTGPPVASDDAFIVEASGELRIFAPGQNRLIVDSDPDEWVGQGLSYDLDEDDGTFITTSLNNYPLETFARVAFDHSNGSDYWHLVFAGPDGTNLGLGTFDGATRFPFNTTEPGMDITSSGRGCGSLEGDFAVDQLERNLDDRLLRLAASFTQTCVRGDPPPWPSINGSIVFANNFQNTASLLANDSDPDGDVLQAVLISGPAHGTLNLRTDGGFTYVSDQGYVGPDSFVYAAVDPRSLQSQPATVTLDVTGVDAPPIVDAITPLDPLSTPGPTIRYEVQFSEPVVMRPEELHLATSGIAGASVADVAVGGDHSSYVVTIDTGSGNGTIELQLLDTNLIKDMSNNRLGGAAVGDGNFTSAAVYNVENNPLRDIVGQVYIDADLDGEFDAGELGSADQTVFLDANGNGVLDAGETTVVTDSGGSFAFADLSLGSHDVAVAAKAGWVLTTASSGTAVLEFDNPSATLNLGIEENLTTISGAVFSDLNSDGFRQPGEVGLENWIVFIDADNDGTLDAGELSTTTAADDPGTASVDESGMFQFAGLDLASYTIAVVPQSGFIPTSPTSVAATLSASTDAVDVDFAVHENLTSISGTVFEDELAANGLPDPGEGISGVVVYLDQNGNGDYDVGEPQATSTTDGSYELPNLAPGSHDVTLVLPNLHNLVAPVGGVHQVSLAADQILTGIDFQLEYIGVEISGVQFIDADLDGEMDVGEQPLANVLVYIDSNNNNWPDFNERRQISGSDGSYRFTDIPAGAHLVRTVSPNHYGSSSGAPSVNRLFGARPMFAGTKDYIHLFEIDPADGTILSQHNTVIGVSAVLGNDIGIAYDGRRVLLTNPLDGDLEWLTTDGRRTGSTPVSTGTTHLVPAIGPAVIDGEVYVVNTGQGWSLDKYVGGSLISEKPISHPIDGYGAEGTPSLFHAMGESADGSQILLATHDSRILQIDPSSARVTGIVTPAALTSTTELAITGMGGEYFVSDISGDGIRVFDDQHNLIRTLPNVPIMSALGGGSFVDSARTVVAGDGDVVANVNHGHRSTWSSISGVVTADVNANGVSDAGEPPMEGVVVYLDENGDGQRNVGERFRITDASGQYHIGHLVAGQYDARIEDQPGHRVRAQAPDRVRLFALHSDNQVAISELDSIDGSILSQFNASVTATSAVGMALHNETLYVANSGGLSRIDADTGAQTGHVALPSGGYDGVAAVGGAIYLQRYSDDTILVFDPDSLALQDSFQVLDGNQQPYDLNGAFGESDDGSKLVIHAPLGELIVDPVTRQVTGTLATSRSREGTAGAGGEIYQVFSTSIKVIGERVEPETQHGIRSFSTGVVYDALAAQQAPSSSHRVYVSGDTNLTGVDFADHFPVPTIRGRLWDDANANGVVDSGESLLAGRTVFLDADGNGLLDGGEASTTTLADDPATSSVDESGTYEFRDVVPGTYSVVQVLPAGWRQTSPGADAYDAEHLLVSGYVTDQNNGTFPYYHSSISADGRFVAFTTKKALLPEDTNSSRNDLYILDRLTGDLELASVDSAEALANGASFNPTISDDGRYVAFRSFGSNLVAEDKNGTWDVFVRDRQLGTTTLVSAIDPSFYEGNATGGSYSYNPSISGDGRYVTFWSNAIDLVPGDTNQVFDLFLRDLEAGTTQRINVDSAGNQAVGGNTHQSHLTYDGRFVAYWSRASNLVEGDTNGDSDIFVLDRQTGVTERVSVSAAGGQANNDSQQASISEDGRYVVFDSLASNLVSEPNGSGWQIYLKDRQTGEVTLVSRGSDGSAPDGEARRPMISGDGRWVVYHSLSTNLVEGDTNGKRDVFLYDVVTGKNTLISRPDALGQGDENSDWARISRDGSTIVFNSAATNLPGASAAEGSMYAVSTFDVGRPGSDRVVTVGPGELVEAQDFGSQIDLDFGDAPDSYGTLLASDGPRHVDSAVFLGAAIDTEADALLVDLDFADDGVQFNSEFVPSQAVDADVTTSAAGELAVWVDFDRSGSFDATERQSFAFASAGAHPISIPVPAGAVPGDTYARFRFASDAGSIADPMGQAADGEVEDYAVTIESALEVVLTAAARLRQEEPLAAQLGALTDQVGANVEQWRVDWGDGRVDAFDSQSTNWLHRYVAAGDYQIRVDAMTDLGTFVDLATHSVQVDAAAPNSWNRTDQGFLTTLYQSLSPGAPSLESFVEPTINVDVGVGSYPQAGNFLSDLGVRWVGSVTPQHTALHTFIVQTGAQDVVRLTIDGNDLIDTIGSPTGDELSASLSLTEGVPIDVEVEWEIGAGNSKISLMWETPFSLRELIRPEYVTHAELPPSQYTGHLQEIWTGVLGSSISDLLDEPSYISNQPTTASQFYASGLKAGPYNLNSSYDNNGRRIRTILRAPESGFYSFALSGSGESELRLRRSIDSNLAELIAWSPLPTAEDDFDDHPSQISEPIYLTAGTEYGIEVLQKNDGTVADDHVTVAWNKPSESPGSYTVIPSTAIRPVVPKVSIQAEVSEANEADAFDRGLVFAVTREDDLGRSMWIDFTLGGTAEHGVDYPWITHQSITIPVGEKTARLVIDPIDDLAIEGPETIVIRLEDGPFHRFWLGDESERTATATIRGEFSSVNGGSIPFGGTDLLPDDPILLSNISWTGQAPNTTNPTVYTNAVIDEIAAPFSDTLQIDVGDFVNNWNARAVWEPNAAVNQSDTMLAVAWARSTNPDDSDAKLVLRMTNIPTSTGQSRQFTVGTQWEKLVFPYSANQSIAAGDLRFDVRVAFPETDSIEIGGVRFVNYRNAYDAQTLLATATPDVGIAGDNVSASTDFGAGSEFTTIPISDPNLPFSWATRVDVEALAEPWHVRRNWDINLAVSQGDWLVGRFFIRSGNTDGSPVNVTTRFQRAVSPWDGYQESHVVGDEWQQIIFRVRANDDFWPGDIQSNSPQDEDEALLQLQFGHADQIVEFGGVALYNHGPDFDPWFLPKTQYSYAGRAADAAWRAAAEISRQVQRDDVLQLTVTDALGAPEHGARITLTPIETEYQIGAAVDYDWVAPTAGSQSNTADGLRYQSIIPQLFGRITDERAQQWSNWADDPTAATELLAWAVANGLTVDGHSILWGVLDGFPTPVAIKTTYDQTLANQGAAAAEAYLESEITAYVQASAAATLTGDTAGGDPQIARWNVLNEPTSSGDIWDITGEDFILAAINAARLVANANSGLLVNERDILSRESGGREDAFYQALESYLAASSPIDGIGLAGRFESARLPSIDSILSDLDRFAALGLAMQVTQFDLISSFSDPQTQADFTRDLLLALESHGGVDATTLWGFWEGAQERSGEGAALFNADWSVKPNGQALLDYLRADNIILETSATGEITTSLPRGSYEATITTVDGESFTAVIDVNAGGTIADIEVPDPPPITVTTVGDAGVNATAGHSDSRSGVASITLDFSEPVTVSGAGSLSLWNHTTSTGVDLTGAALGGNGTAQLSWDLSSLALPDGNYTAELAASEFDGAHTHAFHFHVLAADGNGNRAVDVPDYLALLNHFGDTGGSPYTDGDFNGDGDVNVPDYLLLLNNFGDTLAPLDLDFGDAPESDTSFPTTLANDGAHHAIGSGLFLGTAPDGEADGQPSAAADGDVTGTDDEDGISIAPLEAGTEVSVNVMATVPSGSPVLNGWIDFNADGDWDDAGEQVLTNQLIVDGLNTLSIAIPSDASLGNVYARFRLTNAAGYSYAGFAPDGEVEDYQLTIVAASGGSSAPLVAIELIPAAEDYDEYEFDDALEYALEETLRYDAELDVTAYDAGSVDYDTFEEEDSRYDDESTAAQESLNEQVVDAAMAEPVNWSVYS